MTGLSEAGRARIAAIRGARSLSALADVVDAPDEHGAYLDAKDEWRRLRGRELGPHDPEEAMPGATVVVGDRRYHVHGITHADTDAEREFLRENVTRLVDADRTVYSEQGIRSMYLRDLDVCEMDDYRWALRECRRLGIGSYVDGDPFDSLAEGIDDLAGQFQTAAFSLVDASGNRFGREFERTLGSVASAFFTSHADHATGSDFSSFRLRQQAADDPSLLWKLQRYYECAFLPQPLEREWLRRHDPKLELVTHARNARMVDYAIYHAPPTTPATDVHLVVGAAHQPGIRYYLERHRDGDRSVESFSAVLE
jgi:hypothetical protein